MFKTTKAKIRFVSIFSALCIIITILLIWYHKIDISNENTEEEMVENVPTKDINGIDLNGTYNQNDLKIEEKFISQEKVEIRYLQINGLKDKKIEDKINKEIEIKALNIYKEKIKDLNEVVNVSVSMWEAANFANTISFEMYYYAKIDDNDDGFYQKSMGLNYDLNTGEEITIDRIFTSDAPIEEMLRKSAYYSFIWRYTEETLSGDLTVKDYGDIEDDVVQIIQKYKRGQLRDFYYTPTNILIFYNDEEIISIKMKDYAEYIAIYNRYLSEESLFERNDIGMKNVFTLSTRHNDMYYYTNYQNEKNYFVDILIDFYCSDSDEFGKKVVNEKINEIEREIERIKQLAQENPDSFYILNYNIYVNTWEEWSTNQYLTTCCQRGNSYEMTVHDFEENIKPIIIEYVRQDEGGGVLDYVYNFKNMLKIEPYENIEYYDPETEEKIVI